jgi:hypothetical protein
LERKHKISLDQVRDNEKSREKAREGESGMWSYYDVMENLLLLWTVPVDYNAVENRSGVLHPFYFSVAGYSSK